MVGLNQGSISNVGVPFAGIKHFGYGREPRTSARSMSWSTTPATANSGWWKSSARPLRVISWSASTLRIHVLQTTGVDTLTFYKERLQ